MGAQGEVVSLSRRCGQMAEGRAGQGVQMCSDECWLTSLSPVQRVRRRGAQPGLEWEQGCGVLSRGITAGQARKSGKRIQLTHPCARRTSATNTPPYACMQAGWLSMVIAAHGLHCSRRHRRCVAPRRRPCCPPRSAPAAVATGSAPSSAQSPSRSP